ncbi:hypothetical protein [Geobacter sp. FeAm09]|uniref:hypothetical protein n=1 Tax=Geobacter sp. FeAm09 TaxID=2597769 RepID=UPI00143D3FF2|nr:hypothetical protein [Geobacter sp. FeAm09]
MNPRRLRPELPGTVKRIIVSALFFTAPFFYFAYLTGGDTLKRHVRNYRLTHGG